MSDETQEKRTGKRYDEFSGSATIKHYEDCFRRIAEAVGVEHPCQLMALIDDNEQTYADGLVLFIENKMKPNV